MKPETNICAAVVVAIAIAIALEWHWFAGSVREFVLPTFPGHHDQTRYLAEAFVDDAAIRQHGVWTAFVDRVTAGSPSGALFDFAGALGFRLVEANRLGALAVIFAHFAALQLVFLYVATWATRSVAYGVLAVALLVSSGFLFVVPGGWFDFRIDAAASCSFGIFVALVVRSDLYRSRRWAVAAGVCAGYLIALRHNMVVHLTALHLALLAVVLARQRSEPSGRRAGFALSVATAVGVAAPFLYFSYPHVVAYYSSQLAARGPIRAELSGRSALGHWAFYPYNVVVQHVRFMPIIWLLALGLPWAARRGGGAGPSRLDVWSRYLPLAIAVVVPLAILTAHPDRSTTVAGLVLPPIALASAFAIADLTRAAAGRSRRGAGAIHSTVRLGFALTVLAAAITVHALQHHLWRETERPQLIDGAAVFDMHHQIGRAVVARGLVRPAYVINSLEPELAPDIVSTAMFERERRLVVPRLPVIREQIFPVADDELWRVVRSADVMLLQTAGPRLAFPFVERMRSLENHLIREADERFDAIGDWNFTDSAASAYIARARRAE